MISVKPTSPFFVSPSMADCPAHRPDRASLVPYWPAKNRPDLTAVIVCPGGGYWERMDGYEGRDFALWLNELGIAAFVLRYRLASDGWHYPEITNDIAAALRVVRSLAGTWGLGRIGVLGASAGGHLASYALTHFGRDSQASASWDQTCPRPDFGILCYPVVTFTSEGAVEEGTKKNLLGDNDDAELPALLSSELHVTAETPPCFLWHCRDDKTVSVENAVLFANSLRNHNVRHVLHIYPTGGHGLGLGVSGWHPGHPEPLHPWTRELAAWLGSEGLL